MFVLPRRRIDLVVTELDGENVVFDAADNTVHALAPTAVAVWALCDGKMSVDAAADQLGLTAAEVTGACDDLLAAGLAVAPGYTRRRVLQGTAVAAGAALVSSTFLPAAASADSNPGGGGGGTPNPVTFDLYSSAFTAGSPFSFYQVSGGAYVPCTATYSHPEYNPPSPVAPVGVQGTLDKYPTFYKTPDGAYTAQTISVPQGTFAFHPANSSPAVIGFKNASGQTAKISLSATITRRDTTGNGDGVELSAAQTAGDSAPSNAGPITLLPTDGPASFSTVFNSVPDGHSIYLVLSPRTEYSYDSTGINLSVTVG